MGFAAFGHRREFLLRYLNRFHSRGWSMAQKRETQMMIPDRYYDSLHRNT